jgi:hypothetical protein
MSSQKFMLIRAADLIFDEEDVEARAQFLSSATGRSIHVEQEVTEDDERLIFTVESSKDDGT